MSAGDDFKLSPSAVSASTQPATPPTSPTSLKSARLHKGRAAMARPFAVGGPWTWSGRSLPDDTDGPARRTRGRSRAAASAGAAAASAAAASGAAAAAGAAAAGGGGRDSLPAMWKEAVAAGALLSAGDTDVSCSSSALMMSPRLNQRRPASASDIAVATGVRPLTLTFKLNF